MSDQDSSPLPQAPRSPVSSKNEGISSGCIVEGMPTGGIVALVLGVVGFVFLFLVPPKGSPPPGTAHRLQTKAQMQGLVLAVKAYQAEYNRLPSLKDPSPTKDNAEGYDTTNQQGRGLIDILTATDVSKNPRQIPFYEPPPAKKIGAGYTTTGGLVDIWGTKGYIILLDYNGDGQITDPEDPELNIKAPVAVYSAGPDGDYSTWKDNEKSW